VIATVMTAAVVVATCCGSMVVSAPREGSLAVAIVLPVTLGALDEHRLVGTDASDLSTLAGARGGTVSATLRAQKRKD
jgi:hypothetical protein